MNLDQSTIIEIATAIFSGYSAYSNIKMRAEIMTLKFWIIQNFHAKPTAEFDK